MAGANPIVLAFNRGRISPLALARTDLERVAQSAVVQTNYMPRTLGSMMLRPGFKYLGRTHSDAIPNFIPFAKRTSDTAALEMTAQVMRVWVDDELIQRPAVTTIVANSTFTTDLTSWTDNDESGGTSAWAAGGYLSLIGNGTAAAIRDQQVTTVETGTLHALRVVVFRGPATLRVGSSSGDDDYIEEVALGAGDHSLTFTPTGDFHIRLMARTKRAALVNACYIEAGGAPLELPTPWLAADVPSLRFDGYKDVIYVTCRDCYQQRKIERRDGDSWSVVSYQAEDGPFQLENTSTITLTPSSLSGNISVTASRAYFRSTHVGAIFRLTSSGQLVTQTVTAENSFTDPVRVTGVDSSRTLTYTRSGTWTATVTLQRSLTSDAGPWEDIETKTINGSDAYNDTLDNLEAWYRAGVKTGDFTSGSLSLTINYSVGSVDGIVRITDYTNATTVGAEVLRELGGLEATEYWAEGQWSDRQGWPSAAVFHDGRLFWPGEYVNGSVVDQFQSFDADVEGSSGTISRSLSGGQSNAIAWALSLRHLMVGTEGEEHSIKASELDEQLTPTAWSDKVISTEGSADVAAVKADDSGFFVQASGNNVFQVTHADIRTGYQSTDITVHVPEIGEPGITKMIVQRKPDMRVHCLRSDGTVAVLVRDDAENVLCWVDVETYGPVVDILRLPASGEDAVYYVVTDASGQRFVTRWAKESEASGATTVYDGVSATVIEDLEYRNGTVVTVRDANGTKIENLTVTDKSITLSSAATYAHITPAAYHLADAYVHYSGAATATITGLPFADGTTVVCSADGQNRGEFTVTSGQITLSETVEEAVVGKGYTAKWKGTKLAYAAQYGTAINQRGIVRAVGLVAQDLHATGVTYGPDFDNLDDLPGVEAGEVIDDNHVHREYDFDMFPFLSNWSTDPRVCLQSSAPKPATILALTIGMERHDTT